MKRRACIEFLGHNTIQVTTFCNQIKFDLNKLDGKALNLVTLKLCSIDDKVEFSVIVSGGSGLPESPYQLGVYAITDEHYRVGKIEYITLYDQAKIFSVTFPN